MSSDDEVIYVEEHNEPFIHKAGKLMLGTLAGFLATAAAEKLYDVALEAIRARKAEKE